MSLMLKKFKANPPGRLLIRKSEGVATLIEQIIKFIMYSRTTIQHDEKTYFLSKLPVEIK